MPFVMYIFQVFTRIYIVCMCMYVPSVIIVCLSVCLSVLSLDKKLTKQENQEQFFNFVLPNKEVCSVITTKKVCEECFSYVVIRAEPLKCPLESFLTGSEVFYSSVQHIGRLNLMPCPAYIATKYEEH